MIVHEWTDPALVGRVGAHHARHPGRYRLLFHDTHHRAVTQPEALAAFDLSAYDGVLAFGACLRDLYLARRWARRAWIWHEAADTALFQPRAEPAEGDLVWIGNWGDDERSAELHEFLIEPVRALGLRARVYGVRYPEAARRALADAGIEYAGWLPNFDVPSVFARFRVTVHVPRRPYVEALPGIPTIRPFEALACGIPLVSRALARHRAAVRRRPRLPGRRATAPRCAGSWAGALDQRPGDAPVGARAADDRRAPHLRASGRRAAGHRRRAGRRRGTGRAARAAQLAAAS